MTSTQEITIEQAIEYVREKEAELGNVNPVIYSAVHSVEDGAAFWTILVDSSWTVHGNKDKGHKNEWEVWIELPYDGAPYVYGEC